MRSSTHGNTLTVDDGRDIMGVSTFHDEGDQRPLSPRRSDQPQRVDLAQPPLGVGQKIVLVGSDPLLADGVNVIDRRTQPNRFDDSRCSCFEFVRRIAIGHPIPPHFADHFAAAIVRPHGYQMLVLGIEHTDPGGSVQLVAGKNVEIAIDVADVDRQMHRRMATR